MSRRAVGIWGSYDYGNFGDDLMATIFARQVSVWGYEPVVFSANAQVVEPFRCQLVKSIGHCDEALAGVVMGGGAMLSSESWLRYRLRPLSRRVDAEFRELLEACRRHNYRVIPVSIGGDGVASAGIYGARRQFFASEHAPAGSVRLRGDLDQLRLGFGKTDYAYFPDILFATRLVLPLPECEKANSQVPRIGVNVHAGKGPELLRALQDTLPEAQLLFVRTHSSYFSKQYEYEPQGANSMCYERASDFLQELRGLDLIISDKLHVGLVAAVYGVPFLSYRGKSKTVGLHRELGLVEALVTEARDAAAKAKRIVEKRTAPMTLAERIVEEGLDTQACGHLDLLRVRLNEACGGLA
jgi:hypothetical protein